MKKICIALILLASFLLTGCKENYKSVSDITDSISKAVTFDTFLKGDDKILKELYNINPEDAKDYNLYVASQNILINEILIIEMKDADKVADAKEKIEKRVEDLKKLYKDYLPEQYKLTEDMIYETHGNTIIMAITSDNKKVHDALKELYK